MRLSLPVALRVGSIAAALAALALLAMPQLWHPFSRDHGELAACAQTLLRGGALYRDCWENKGLLTYPFFMLPLAIAPTMASVRVFDMIWQALTSLALGAALARMAGRTWIGALAGALYWAAYTGSGFWNTAQSETFAAIFIVGLVYGAWTATRGGRRDRLWWLVAGLCAGVLAWIKYVNVLIGIAVGLQLVVRIWRLRGLSMAIQSGVVFAAGVLAVSAAATAFLVVSGAWPAFLAHLEFLSGPFVVQRSFAEAADALWLNVRAWSTSGYHIGPPSKETVRQWEVLGYGFPVMILMALYAVLERWRNVAMRLWALAWLAGAIEVVWQARYSYYHFMVLLLPLVALACLTLPKAARPLRFATAACVLALVALVIGNLPWIGDWYSNAIVQGRPPLAAYRDTSLAGELTLSDWIQDHTEPDDRIVMWAVGADVYFLSGRRNATSFNMLLPFEYASRYREGWIRQFLDEMAANPPRYFITTRDGYPVPAASAITALKNAVPINDYVESRYRYVGEMNVYLIYERK